MSNDLKQRVLAAFFPNKCPCCNTAIRYNDVVCVSCLKTFSPAEDERCKICADENCNCKNDPKFYKSTSAVFLYKGSILRAIISLKKLKNRGFFEFFAENICQKLPQNANFDVVIAVPMHKSDKRKRGYNQSEVLAEIIAKKLNIPHCKKTLFCRKKPFSQHNLTSKQRAENIKDIYFASLRDFSYQKILLVDDVKTTGLTMNECAKALVLAGVSEVHCACIACV